MKRTGWASRSVRFLKKVASLFVWAVITPPVPPSLPGGERRWRGEGRRE
jgi:hypothetical protein